MKKIFSVLFALTSFLLYASEFLDVETLPFSRMQQYSLGSYRRIVIFSAPRTGSSLTYNVCRFLFERQENLDHAHNEFHLEYNVLKTHKLSEVEMAARNDVLYIITVRPPLDSILSAYRILPVQVRNEKQWCKTQIDQQVKYFNYINEMRSKGRNILLIKYEDFQNNLEFLLRSIEDHFSISIAPVDRELMLKGYSKDNIHQNIRRLQNFREHLPLSGFHGKHVSLTPYKTPEQILYWLNRYYQNVAFLFKEYE